MTLKELGLRHKEAREAPGFDKTKSTQVFGHAIVITGFKSNEAAERFREAMVWILYANGKHLHYDGRLFLEVKE